MLFILNCILNANRKFFRIFGCIYFKFSQSLQSISYSENTCVCYNGSNQMRHSTTNAVLHFFFFWLFCSFLPRILFHRLVIPFFLDTGRKWRKRFFSPTLCCSFSFFFLFSKTDFIDYIALYWNIFPAPLFCPNCNHNITNGTNHSYCWIIRWQTTNFQRKFSRKFNRNMHESMTTILQVVHI